MEISNQANICFLFLGSHTHVQLEDLAEGLMILSLYSGFFLSLCIVHYLNSISSDTCLAASDLFWFPFTWGASFLSISGHQGECRASSGQACGFYLFSYSAPLHWTMEFISFQGNYWSVGLTSAMALFSCCNVHSFSFLSSFLLD